MYKAWGDSTGVQVFNGQPNSINVDGTTIGVPNSDIVRVDRAYFDWNRIGGSGLYVSIGRRPSTGGPTRRSARGKSARRHAARARRRLPVRRRHGRLRVRRDDAGCDLAVLLRLGYESGFGSGDQLRAPADRLNDVQFGGVNMDLYATDTMFVQATALRAMRT